MVNSANLLYILGYDSNRYAVHHALGISAIRRRMIPTGMESAGQRYGHPAIIIHYEIKNALAA